MSPDEVQPRIAYLVKRYPRFSETFIVNEVLAHEEAGLHLDIVALSPCIETHFQDSISRVRSSVHYLFADGLKAADLWSSIREASLVCPEVLPALERVKREDAKLVYQALELVRFIKRRGITHLHAHFATSATSVARIASLLCGIPYSFTAHAKDIFHDEVKPDELRSKLADAAQVVTVSDFNVRYLREQFDKDASNVIRIYNGMDVARLHFRSPEKRRPVILSVGRLVEKKGFCDLIAACAELRRRHVEFTCEIIGEGELYRELEQQICKLQLNETVRLSGPMPQDRVFEKLYEASVFAAPCIIGRDNNRDGMPTVLLESMALGTPCVSTDVTGIPEIIIDHKTGLLTPQRDHHSLANALQELLAAPDLRSTLARNARTLIESQFDVRRNTAQLRSIFMPSVHTNEEAHACV